ncbi:acid phosphatase type 7 [Lingula anatina]|uniref:Purple acid phosphatase n=1 Tax=Lingula anatina TaxID=7574 RepID=A0A1S3HKN8_LINAN|nr:acid phosphatase type 7 [Lingula anatina]|eukprot:XP_013386031.1 acid phosphatase type 7 [Lingula anatina]
MMRKRYPSDTSWGCNKKHLAIFMIILMLLFGISSPLWNLFARVSHDGSKPYQVHISLGDTLSEMTVMWATVAEGEAGVLYGKSSQLDMVALGESKKFVKTNEEGMHNIHRVQLRNLELDTVYYYKVRTGRYSSRTFSFRTLSEDSNWTPEVIILADMGSSSKSIRSVQTQVQRGNITAVFHVGDFAYNLNSNGGERGDEFLNRIEGIASRTPYMTCPGDHEAFDKFMHYMYRFSMPHSPWPIPLDKLWYSINIGQAHFVFYSTTLYQSNPEVAKIQNDWLFKDLSQANKERTLRPWIVVLGHKPLYCSKSVKFTQECNSKDSVIRENVERMFYDFKVNLIFSGHVHAYERYYPLYENVVMQRNYINPVAPVSIITALTGISVVPESYDEENPRTAYRMASENREAFGKLKIINSTHLSWEVVYSDTLQSLDKMLMVQTKLPIVTEETISRLKSYMKDRILADAKWVLTEKIHSTLYLILYLFGLSAIPTFLIVLFKFLRK